MKQIAKGGLLTRKFDTKDVLLLLGFLVLTVFQKLLARNHAEPVTYLFEERPFDMLIGTLLIFAVSGSSLGIRFRNIYFSVLWLLLSVWIAYDSLFVLKAPLLLFFVYHLIRWRFHRKYNREFISSSVSQVGYVDDYHSKIENRSNSKEDKIRMNDLFICGLITYFAALLIDANNYLLK